MMTTQTIFVVFFAIFWGAVACVQGRWKMFHWPLIYYRHVAARLVLSFILLNILPILFFASMFFLLRNTPVTQTSKWAYSETLRQVAAGVIPAFAVFGFYRFWLAAVEFSPTTFYQHEKDQDNKIKGADPTIEILNIQSQFWPLNLTFALLYLAIATCTPWLLAP
jgi:hypothetical protein